ncbi:hypothetical protein N7512_001190 [Penicillium capsulatum]|nr:hypothetical protein N7512_001190 [Penicillium capsulatum]
MQWTDNGFCKGKNDQNAMWLQLGDGLANLQAFMTRFGDAVSEHGHAITDSMQHFYDLLHPVHLEDNTPAWSIIIGAVLAGISDGFAKSPENSLNTSQTGDDREEKMAKVFLTINDELNKFTAKVIEDVHSAPQDKGASLRHV